MYYHFRFVLNMYYNFVYDSCNKIFINQVVKMLMFKTCKYADRMISFKLKWKMI